MDIQSTTGSTCTALERKILLDKPNIDKLQYRYIEGTNTVLFQALTQRNSYDGKWIQKVVVPGTASTLLCLLW
jgi:hypothetical protein